MSDNNHGVWQLWDEFDIVSASLFGYWHPAPPVRGHPAALSHHRAPGILNRSDAQSRIEMMTV